MEEPQSSSAPASFPPPQPTVVPPAATPAQPVSSQSAPVTEPAPTKTDVFGIISLITLFLGLQLVGVILGIIGMRKAKREGYNGVLSIVGFWLNLAISAIVILGVILLLVFMTSASVSTRADDAKRKTDVSAIQNSLEAYYVKNHSYPALEQLQDDAWVSANLTSLSPAALQAPGATVNSISVTASANTYKYIPTPQGCTTLAKDCTGYTLTAMTGALGTEPIVKVSLGQ